MLSLLELIGLLSVTFIFYLFVNFTWRLLYTTRIGSMLGKSIKMKDMGEWAVVTGATDGIGKAYAEECARHGINTVLISRSLNKLQNVALEIESRYDVKTKTIDVDFTNGPEIFEKIAKNIEGLDIGILINNVGMSYSYPEFLDQVEDSVGFAMRLVNCNCISVVRMSIMVLPQMVQKRKGLIINVSSAAALLPTPLMTMYSSTKAFVHKFSQDISLEYRPYGVTIQCVLPGFVATNMSRIRRSSLSIPTPEKFVKEHLKTLGLEVWSAGYWCHNLQAFVLKFSQDLALEYKPCGVVVQCVTPGFVATNMSRIRRHSLSIPTPQTFVKEHIHTFGLETWSGGYWYHKLQWAYYGNLMLFLESYVENLCRRSLALIREKAKKKRAAQKEKLALLEEKKVELGKEHTA